MKALSAPEVTSNLWTAVCRARGTPLPDPAHVSGFLRQLDAAPLGVIHNALNACLLGREQGADMDLVSWAAKCTRPGYLASLHQQELPCSGSTLFSAGLSLMESGWDMSGRIAQLKDRPDDVVQLRAAVLSVDGPVQTDGAQLSSMAGVEPEPDAAEPIAEPRFDPAVPASTPATARRKTVSPRQEGSRDWPDDGLSTAAAFEPEVGLRPSAPRVKLKLYGRDAAHTLECGPHKRSADFLGVHVVTIESARALDGGHYDWDHKLLIQFTPEEMPCVLPVLMGLSSEVRLGHHGTHHDKFVEIRRQKGGLVVVTGQTGFQFAVPVKSATVYYMLDLFCRAMTMGETGRSVADVLALARSLHSD